MKGVSVVKIFPVLVLLILLFGIALPALADYLGPNRTVTTWVWERKRCEYVALYDPPGSGYYACTLRLYEPPDGACLAGGSTAPYFNPHPNACGASWPGTCGVDISCQISLSESLEACQEGESSCRQTAHTVTYPEAAIHGELRNCSLQNGWCVTLPWLSLRAVEPLAGYSITAIEGTHNGEAFACQSTACEMPLLEGENAFTFWALSNWGDSSRLGTLTARVDTRPPLVNGEISGTLGENGWYVSPVTISASASDPQPGSGIQALTYTLGGVWQPYAAPFTLSDGVHTLLFRAEDAAGHTAEASISVQVDTQPPALEASLDGEQVNGWYVRQATLTASAEDGLSGLARLEYALDGPAWRGYTAPVAVGDGVHTLLVRAVDVAGNAQESRLDFRVDGAGPGIALPESWPIWERVAVTAHDGQSGLAKVEVTVRDRRERWPAVSQVYAADGASFTTEIAWDRRFGDGTLAPIGEYDVVVEAQDAAGNTTWETAHILIPAPGVTPTPLPSAASQQTSSLEPPLLSGKQDELQAFPTATQALSFAGGLPTGPSPVPALPFSPVCNMPSTLPASGQADFPWWLVPAGMSLASGLALLHSFLKQSGSGQVVSLRPSSVTVSVPKIVQRRTTVGEWVTRPVRTLVQITRTIFRTIVEAIPRFITITRQVIDRIVHSEWVTTFRQVAKTFWETVTEKVPLLGRLGKVIGFIWKTVVKPVVCWVTEAMRTLRTWVENVVRWVVERIQDGWNYLTRQIAETIREWVEKVEWIRKWVTKDIIVPQVVWETRVIALPAWNDPANIYRLLQLGATVGLGTISLSMCATATSTPVAPTPDISATQSACATQTVAAWTQTVPVTFAPTLVTVTATAVISPFVDIWNTNTHVSNEIVDDIIGWEGYAEFPYNDSTNNCTVGIGHKLHDGPCSSQELSTRYAPEQIQEWFKQDLSEAESYVRAMFQTLDNEFRPNQPAGNPFPITQAQFDALVSFTFNAGAGSLIDLVRSTIQPDTGTFDYEKFSHLMTTRYAQGGPGLLPRRQGEVDLFVYGIYP